MMIRSGRRKIRDRNKLAASESAAGRRCRWVKYLRLAAISARLPDQFRRHRRSKKTQV